MYTLHFHNAADEKYGNDELFCLIVHDGTDTYPFFCISGRFRVPIFQTEQKAEEFMKSLEENENRGNEESPSDYSYPVKKVKVKDIPAMLKNVMEDLGTFDGDILFDPNYEDIFLIEE